MVKVTLRFDDAVWSAVKVEAKRAGKSANAFMADTLTAATDPTRTGEDFERLRERLRRAGVLRESSPRRRAAP